MFVKNIRKRAQALMEKRIVEAEKEFSAFCKETDDVMMKEISNIRSEAKMNKELKADALVNKVLNG